MIIDCDILQKKIEDELFKFMDEILNKFNCSFDSRISYYNEITNFVENKIFPFCHDEDIYDMELENEDLEEQIYKLENAFQGLQSDVIDCLDNIQSDIEDMNKDSIGSIHDTIDKISNFVSKKTDEFRDVEIDY